MNESPAPTVSATVTAGATTSTSTPVAVTTTAPSPPRVTTTAAGPSVAQRRAWSSGSVSGSSQPRSSSLTLTTSAERDERLDDGARLRGWRHERRTGVRVVGEGGRGAVRLEDPYDVGAAGLEDGADRSRVHHERRGGRRRPVLGHLPRQVELVGRGARRVEHRRGDRGVVRGVGAGHDGGAGGGQVRRDARAALVGPEPGEQVHAAAEPRQADRDVHGASRRGAR